MLRCPRTGREIFGERTHTVGSETVHVLKAVVASRHAIPPFFSLGRDDYLGGVVEAGDEFRIEGRV